VSAASILAKVSRDREMVALAPLYPQYGFAGHKGYGSSAHIDAIRQYGYCDIHRKSFN
jgi:ribonuclease HII